MSAMTVGAFALLARPSGPLLVWNLTESAPKGLYWLSSAEPLRRGDLVVARPSIDWQRYAEKRHYLGAHVPLVKHVVALVGDRVCADATSIWVNGARRVKRRPVDGLGRALPRWTGCRLLSAAQVLLLNPDNAASFDGRYFGPSARQAILGRAVKL
jgi:conjugative transfer signal peptidase TraF